MAAAVIHGRQDTIIRAPGNSATTPYVSSLQVNGSSYPSYLISGQTLASTGHTLTFGMTSTPSRIGRLDLAGTDGEVLSGSTDNRTYLSFSIDPLGGTSRADVQVAEPPVTVTVNGRPLPGADWSYRPGEHLVTLLSLPPGTVRLRFGGVAGEASAWPDQPVPAAAGPVSPMTIVFPRTFAEPADWAKITGWLT